MSKGKAWAQAAIGRAERIRQDLRDPHRPQHDYTREADFAKSEVEDRVTKAIKLAEDPTTLAEWWNGSRIEECWRELRLAEEGLVYIADRHQLPAIAQDALNHAQAYLPAGDKRVEQLKAAQRDPDKVDELRASIVPVLSGGHEASDKTHQDLRSYQNSLRLLTTALSVLAVVSATAAVLWLTTPLFLKLEGVTSGWAVAFAFMAGAAGALFSAIPSVAQIPASQAPFNPVWEQAGLKVAVGAWSAIVGLLVVTAGIATAPGGANSSTSLAGLLIIAALFGANQEALTRFADNKASKLRAAASP
jgi:hypothetical protein